VKQRAGVLCCRYQDKGKTSCHLNPTLGAVLLCNRGYAFQMEVAVRAQYHGYRIEEVPIVFVDR
jgi:hypothetical protein